jgi:transposase
LNLEAGLRRFLTDARIPLDNTDSERALRGVVLGHKNHDGSRSRRGTEVAAMLYTLLESAKLAGVSPRAYLSAMAELAIRTPGATLTPESFKLQQATKPA